MSPTLPSGATIFCMVLHSHGMEPLFSSSVFVNMDYNLCSFQCIRTAKGYNYMIDVEGICDNYHAVLRNAPNTACVSIESVCYVHVRKAIILLPPFQQHHIFLRQAWWLRRDGIHRLTSPLLATRFPLMKNKPHTHTFLAVTTQFILCKDSKTFVWSAITGGKRVKQSWIMTLMVPAFFLCIHRGIHCVSLAFESELDTFWIWHQCLSEYILLL